VGPREVAVVGELHAAGDRHPVGIPLEPFPSRARTRWPSLPGPLVAVVFVGGVGGGLVRYAVTSVWTTPTGRFPWATSAVNTSGTFALALLVAVLAELGNPHRYVRPLVGTGFLGAFTTFSSVTLSVDQLLAHGHPHMAALYLGGSVGAALGAGSLGLLLGRALAGSRHRTRERHRRRTRERHRTRERRRTRERHRTGEGVRNRTTEPMRRR
jgi:fluoride exporter